MLSLSRRKIADDAPTPRGIGLMLRHPRRVHLRGLDRRDAPMLAAHLLRLSPEDRRARFHGAMSDYAINAYVHRIDWRRAYIFGAWIGGELRGVAELAPLPGPEGEIAVSVETRCRQDGLGLLLVVAAMLAARRIGLPRVTLSYLPRNTAMAALARDLGATTRSRPQVIEAVITLPPANAGPDQPESPAQLPL